MASYLVYNKYRSIAYMLLLFYLKECNIVIL